MSDRGTRVRTALRILNVRLRFIALMLVTGLLAANWDTLAAHWERWTTRGVSTGAPEAEAVEYYCPMHPSVVRGETGNCPICGMPLSKRLKGAETALPGGVIGRVSLTPYRMQLAGVATTEVAARPLRREVRAFGSVELEERRVSRVSARVAGRIERVMADYPDGKVSAGDPLVEIYSPELIATVSEYLAARDAAGSSEVARPVAEAARERLRLWGMGDADIAAAEARGDGEGAARITLRSPVGGVITRRNVLLGQYVSEGTELYDIADLSRLWITASVAESDAAGLRTGLPVEAGVPALPGRTFTGEIDFVEPVVGVETRTLRVRALVPNPDHELRPGMYAEMRIALPAVTAADGGAAHGATPALPHYECPMKCDDLTFTAPGSCPVCHMDLVKVEAPPAGEALAVPESAVIDTGTRKVVYLEREPGVFDAIPVELGPRAEGWYPVLRGLSRGDRVVSRGAFLVDAELRLSPGAAASYFGASGGPSGS